MTDIPDDDLFLLLAHRHRRRVVQALLDERAAPISITEFLESAIERERERAEFERHVEMLQDAGIVRYDESAQTISRGDSFSSIAPVVRAIARARSLDDSPTNQDPLALVSQALQQNLCERLDDLHVDLAQLREDETGLTEDTHAAVRQEVDDLIRHVETVQAFIDTAADGDVGQREPMPLQELLEQPIAALQRWRNESFVAVETIPDVTVEADQRLPLVFKNLLGHAAEHTGTAESGLRITGRQQNGSVTVVMKNRGPNGRSEYGGPVVHERDTTTTRSETEVDLYFVEQVIATYGGDLTVAGNGPARTEYRVSLPCLDD